MADKGDIAAILEHLEKLREDFNRKVEEDNKRFEGIIAEIKTLREQFNSLASEFLRYKEKVDTLDENFGAFVESYYTTKVVEQLERRHGTSPIKIIKNVSVKGGELDAVIIIDGTVYTLEVSGVLRSRDINKLKRSTDRFAANPEYAGKQVKPIAAGVRIDSHAIELAKHLDVEILYI